MVAYLKAVMESLALHRVEFGDVHGAGQGRLQMEERETGARRILQIESESLWASLPSPTLRGTEPGQRLPQPDVPVIPDEASISAKTGAEGDSPDLSTYFLMPCKHTLPPSLPPWVPVPSHADQS